MIFDRSWCKVQNGANALTCTTALTRHSAFGIRHSALKKIDYSHRSITSCKVTRHWEAPCSSIKSETQNSRTDRPSDRPSSNSLKNTNPSVNPWRCIIDRTRTQSLITNSRDDQRPLPWVLESCSCSCSCSHAADSRAANPCSSDADADSIPQT